MSSWYSITSGIEYTPVALMTTAFPSIAPRSDRYAYSPILDKTSIARARLDLHRLVGRNGVVSFARLGTNEGSRGPLRARELDGLVHRSL